MNFWDERTCGLCGSGMTRTDGELEDGTPTWQYRCECGETFCIGVEKGELDLGVIPPVGQ